MTDAARGSAESLSLELEREIDHLCDAFEDALRAGKEPRINVYDISELFYERSGMAEMMGFKSRMPSGIEGRIDRNVRVLKNLRNAAREIVVHDYKVR